MRILPLAKIDKVTISEVEKAFSQIFVGRPKLMREGGVATNLLFATQSCDEVVVRIYLHHDIAKVFIRDLFF